MPISRIQQARVAAGLDSIPGGGAEEPVVTYEAGVSAALEGEATLVMVDAGFADAPLETIALLEVDDVVVP